MNPSAGAAAKLSESERKHLGVRPLRHKLSPLNFLSEEIRGGRLKTKQKYSAEFKEQALAKVLNRGSRTVGSALFGRLGVLVVRTQLGFFSAPRLTKCIPLIDQVGDSAAFLSL
jgi:hypothetical protein